MAKLNRLTAKIFGETASTTNTPKEIGQFGSAKAGTYNATGDVATIQNLPAWSNGWIDAVTPTDQFPPLPEMTGVHKVLSYQNAYLLQQGIPEWDGATTYYTNGFCSKTGKIYISQTDNNLNNDPASDAVNWKEFEVDLSGKADVDFGNVNNTNNIAATHLNTAGIRTVIETYVNGTSWYRVYSDGWCEQGGYSAGSSVRTVNLLKAYNNTNYSVFLQGKNTDYWSVVNNVDNITGSQFTIYAYDNDRRCFWKACGYIN